MKRCIAGLPAAIGLVSIVWHAAAHSASSATTPSPAASQPIALTKAVTPATSLSSLQEQEVLLLREQVRVMREYHSSLLDTVYWALGGVFGTLLLLAGFGWWSNFKLYEKDKASLRAELEAMLNASQSRIELSVKTSATEIQRAVSASAQAQVDRVQTEQEALRATLAAEQSRTNDLQSVVTNIVPLLKELAGLIDVRYNQSEANLRQVEEQIWLLQGIPNNVLLTQIQGLESAIRAKNQFQVESMLNRMIETVKKQFISKSQKTTDYIEKKLVELLANTPNEYGVQAAELRELVDQIAPQGKDIHNT